MTPASDKLFELLPAFYRARDAREGSGALEDLLAIMQDVLDAMQDDTRALYENWFVETCAEWVVPYIGELLGTQGLYTTGSDSLTARAYVAHTLSYRRRKGTAVALQQLASDVTEWPATAVEFFRLLATTQHMNHLRPENIVTPDLRQSARLGLVGSAFDPLAHTADVRSIGSPPLSRSTASSSTPSMTAIRGRYNIPNLGLFLWRLQSYPLAEAAPSTVTNGLDGRFRFNVLGLDQPLFNRPQTLPAFSKLAEEVDVPGRLRRRALFDELEARRQAMVDGRMVWLAATAFPIGATVVDSNGNTQRALSAGTTGATPPAWPTTRLNQVSDGGILWQMVAQGSTLPGIYFGEQPVFSVTPALGGLPVPPEQIMICDLSDLPTPAAPGTWRTPPQTAGYRRASDGASVTVPITLEVDPVLGHLAFTGPAMPNPDHVRVNFNYGFSGDIGGGPYNRSDSVNPVLTSQPHWQVAVSRTATAVAGALFNSLADAINAWNTLPSVAERFGVIVMLDSDVYAQSLAGSAIQVPGGTTLMIVAAGWPALAEGTPPASLTLQPSGARPTIHADIEVKGLKPASGTSPGTLILNGLLLNGKLTVDAGELGSLQLTHCTLVPSAGGLIVKDAANAMNEGLNVTLTNSICGPIQLAEQVPGLTLIDSIVDESGAALPAVMAPSADASLTRCTVLGTVGSATTVGARSISATDSLFTGIVHAERVQAGCLRFCTLPSAGSHVPRRYRCQPDMALTGVTDIALQASLRARLTPAFTSTSFGDATYAQLSHNCALEICTGAENGSEMGAFSMLKQPQCDTNLRTVLQEYLRFGMQAGIFYET